MPCSTVPAVLAAYLRDGGRLSRTLSHDEQRRRARLLMPIDLQAADKAERNPRLTLMPLSFASILGGMITLIGTPPNIVIATFRQEALGEPYTMFDFAPVGLVVALVGIAYVALIGWRLIPHEGSHTRRPSAVEELERYLVELRVPS